MNTREREQLIVKYMPLVDRLAGLYAGKGVDREDLKQEGYYGLILAIDRYNPDTGAPVEAYAGYYIKKYMSRAVSESLPLKSSAWRKAAEYKATSEQLSESLGRQPSHMEVAEAMGTTYKRAYPYLHGFQSVELDEHLMTGTEEVRGVEDSIIAELSKVSLEDFTSLLTIREMNILRMRLGFDCEPQRVVDIGEAIGICSNSVTRIYKKAIAKLQQSAPCLA